jgi:surfactin synthase thioesterase subunit
MINGRHDRTIRPVQARALFAAAGEPKELRWFDGGHWPPQSVIEEVADWLADRLGERAAHSRLA